MLDGLNYSLIAAALLAVLWRIFLVLILVLAGIQLARRLIPRALDLGLQMRTRDAEVEESPEEKAKRRDTLRTVFVRTVEVVILVVGGLMILSEVGLTIAPVLAGAGIAGVALGFGAQSLVKDLLAGLFILMENQYGRGDVVRVAGVDGVVEDVNLRRTVLRNLDGVVHTVPNGEIKVASNLTRGWSRVNLNITVGYDQDIDRVRSVIDAVGQEMVDDPEWGPHITEPPKVLRVDAFEESGVALKILATTKPMKQWDVAGELRRRLKIAFDREGVAIPYPHRVMISSPEDRDADAAKSERRPAGQEAKPP